MNQPATKIVDWGKKLAPGRHRLVAVPKANGKSGKAQTLSFRIVR